MVTNLYFAYGSNLLESEIRKDAPNAVFYGIAYVTGYRLIFNKHSQTRGGDAANIILSPGDTVWGGVYEVDTTDRAGLAKRERGYIKRDLQANLVQADKTDCLPHVFTFVAERICSHGCGPSESYLESIINGAKERGLPREYLQWLRSLGCK